MTNTKPTGLRMSEIESRLRERANANPMVGRCALCPETFEGTAGEVLEAQIAHRAVHKVKPLSRRSTRHLSSFKAVALTDEDQAGIEAERVKRAFLNGVGA